MELGALPARVPAWCRQRLGREPVAVLFRLDQMSMVLGLRLEDGAEIVVEAREDEGGVPDPGGATSRPALR